jgi:HAD superfamily hydrolase (TIGR01509 family)
VTFVFFDNDGVLVDTEHLYMEASRAVLAERGIDLPEAEYIELFMRQNRGLLHYGEVHGWEADDLRDLRARRNDLYAAMLAHEPLILDGVEETLAALHGRVRMAIVTSSRRDHFDIIHRRTGLLRYFDFVLTDGDYAVSKPDPAPYLAAVARAGVDPRSCLVVEDSERGLASARAAGLRCVIVPSRLTRGARFNGAWRVLDDVRDVARVVETVREV